MTVSGENTGCEGTSPLINHTVVRSEPYDTSSRGSEFFLRTMRQLVVWFGISTVNHAMENAEKQNGGPNLFGPPSRSKFLLSQILCWLFNSYFLLKDV
jgi:hypothetical protein